MGKLKMMFLGCSSKCQERSPLHFLIASMQCLFFFFKERVDYEWRWTGPKAEQVQKPCTCDELKREEENKMMLHVWGPVPWCGHREAETSRGPGLSWVRTPPCPEFICFSWVPLFLFSPPPLGMIIFTPNCQNEKSSQDTWLAISFFAS